MIETLANNEDKSFDNELTFAEVVGILPRIRGKKRHISTVWRWARRGCKAPDGTVIRLKHRRIGGTLTTTREDLKCFFADLAEADLEKFRAQDAAPAIVMPKATQPALRRAQIAQAKAILQEAGI